MLEHPQLTLALDTAPATSFESFYVDASNVVVRDGVRAFVHGDLQGEQIYLWGETGTGKTHLLSAACQAYAERGYRVAYLPGEIVNISSALDGVEHNELLCIDDLQRLDHAAEVDLFHCINRCRESGTRLLIAADRSSDKLGLKLPDLKTRLGWGLVFHLRDLDDQALYDAFRHEIEARSLEASDEVLGYVLRRFPRRISALKTVVNKLDALSLSTQRRITIPFVKSVFDDADRVALESSLR